jgi:hypothetical protein
MTRILSKLLLCLLAIIWLAPVRAADDKEYDQYCGMLPERVVNANAYSGWSACKLRDAGEKPLWKGLPENSKQVTRFVFTQGHGMFFRVVTITENLDGTAELTVFGSAGRSDARKQERPNPKRREHLPSAEVARLNQLGNDSGVWDFEIGSWDGDELYMHCQVLEMERINAQDYRFSSVNIGCNKPAKLMPLVNEIVRLGKMKNTHNGMVFQ